MSSAPQRHDSQQAPKAAAPSNCSASRSREYQEGYTAGLTADIYTDDNPYHHRSKKAREWQVGFCDGADKFIAGMPNEKWSDRP